MIRVEQLVYGTFTFTQGFTLVSRSEGITPKLAQQAVEACKSWGEILTPDFGGALYHVAVPSGDAGVGGSVTPRGEDGAGAIPRSDDGAGTTHLVGKVLRQGVDAGGRMAWFHQLLTIPHNDYLEGGADPFAYEDAGFFRDRWFEGDQCAALTIDAKMLQPATSAGAAATAGQGSNSSEPLSPAAQQQVAEVSAALGEGAAVRILASRVTKAVRRLMRGALSELPVERRSEISIATLAYRPVRRYDLWCLYEAGGGEPQRIADVVYRIEQ